MFLLKRHCYKNKKRNHKLGGKIFAKHKSDHRLLSRIYKNSYN